MPVATVVIPTHSHTEPLRVTVQSVLRQTVQDFELFISGDGVTEAMRETAGEIAASDPRITFFDFPKRDRKGESNIHEALQHAGGRIVTYIGDDDLWLPDHLAVMGELLRDADFGHTVHIGINRRGNLFARPADIGNPGFRRKMLTKILNRFDFNTTGHTLEAYRRLPHGWRATPEGFPWIDLYMWRQFLGEPWVRAKSLMVPTAICTHTHLRPKLSGAKRAKELEGLLARAGDADFREELWRVIARDFANEAIENGLRASPVAVPAGEVEERETDPAAT